MSQREEHERYLLEAILSHSLSSENPSEETKRKAYKSSPSFFESYKQELMDKYQDFSFDDFKGSEIEDTPSGEVLKITENEKINFKLKENNYKDYLKRNLKLMNGIGIAREEKLKKEGFKSLDDLKNHEKYSANATSCLDNIENLEFPELIKFVKKKQILEGM